MNYKAFQDWYREGNIKHLLLFEHNGHLISPPFSTELCKDYNKIMRYDGEVSYIDTTLPSAVSKTNCVVNVNNNLYFIPYGIYESNYNTVLKLADDIPSYCHVQAYGKGQFYSGASNGTTAFSFPLGYEGTEYCLYIKNDTPSLIPFESVEKAHMGTVYCNGRYYSMPRGDKPGYNDLVSFDGDIFRKYHIPVPREITRKYTDIIVVDTKLYSLPYGEQKGLTDVVEFDTVTEEVILHHLNVPDFAKKFNSMVKVGNNLIGMPYGDEFCSDSNYGVIFNIDTKESKSIDIKINHGGKYRYRCGIEYKNHAVFFPTGTPQCPMIIVNELGDIEKVLDFPTYMFGRPIVHKDKLHVLAYNIINETHHMLIFDKNFTHETIDI